MSTKVQAKAAIDAAVVLAKSDIDNILPATVNILDGSINFNPNKFTFLLDGGGTLAAANTLLNTIKTNLTAAARNPIVTGNQGRRGADPKAADKQIIITTALVVYTIINIG